jgi:RNA polymerase sigma factor for flagellar operon FliA
MSAPSERGRAAEKRRFERVTKTVGLLAHRVHRKFPELSVDDLVSIGNEAAVEASQSFEEERGIPFEVYAFKRIRGAMLRAATREVFDPVNVAVKRAIQTQLELDMTPPAQVDLETALHDTPEKIRARTVQWLRAQAASMLAGALVAQQTGADQPQGEDAFAARDAYAKGHAKLAALLPRLPEEEKTVFEQLYKKSASLDEAAATLGVSKRTIQRVHDKLKERLMLQLRREGVTEEPPLEGRPP